MPATLIHPNKPILTYQIENKLYLNITDRCTLRCRFCPKHRDGPRVQEFDLDLGARPAVAAMIEATPDPARYREVVFCGFGEPTLRLKPLLHIARHIKSRGGYVRLNTDGLANRVHKRNVLPELMNHVDAVSVSMNAHCESVYNRHCRPTLSGSFHAVLEFLSLAPRYIGKVTATAIDGLDDVDIDACRRLARERGVKFKRRILDVVG